MHRRVLFAVAIVCCLAAVAQAALTVSTGGPYSFMTGTVGNKIAITGSVSAGETVGGMNFVVGIGAQDATAPVITAVDLIGPGTVFNPNNTGQFVVGFGVPGTVVVYSVTTAAGTVSPVGTLGFLDISTVGIAPGSYALNLKKNVGFPQPVFNFAPTAVTRDDFSTDATAIINVTPQIPEPASIVLGLFAAAGLGAVVIRRHRARKTA
jgi:hypothetical protein